MLFIPTPEHVVRKTREPHIVKSCFCQEGHSLISPKVHFEGHPGILIKIRQGRHMGYIGINPVCGHKNRIDIDIDLVDGDIIHFLCPVTGLELPVYGPCECGGSLIALFLDDTGDYSNCIGICNRVGCKHSILILANQLFSCTGLHPL